MHRGRWGMRGGRGRLGAWFFGFDEGGGRSEPWGWRRRFFESGEVRLAILSLLSERPMHGYELMKEMEARSGGMYRASAGAIYPNLQQLEDEGLVRSDQRDDGKRVYAITEEGKAELKSNEAGADRIWDRASAWDDWSDAFTQGATEVWGPALRLARAAFRAAARGDAKTVEKIRQIIAKASEEIEKLSKAAPAGRRDDDVD